MEEAEAKDLQETTLPSEHLGVADAEREGEKEGEKEGMIEGAVTDGAASELAEDVVFTEVAEEGALISWETVMGTSNEESAIWNQHFAIEVDMESVE
ncbi:unnamed protein product [Brassica oleracea]|uniref:(rape) hypothetical protein n=1 Tax=Brassica napus TaxID=3708 RepID=A0A816IW88_BRANA|nr:unnamed protein product [Brassica napus]